MSMIRFLRILQSILMKSAEKPGELSGLERSEDGLLILRKHLVHMWFIIRLPEEAHRKDMNR